MLLLFLITLQSLTMQNINKLIYELLSDRTLSQNALHLYVSPKNVQQIDYILMKVQQNHMIRGREPGGSPRAEGERMSADERKQHDCDQKTFVCSKNALN